MKMPEKHDLLAAILAAKEQGIGQSLRLQWRTFAADIMAVRLQKQQSTERCAPLSPSSFVTFDFAGLSSNLAYITSVFIGYIGTDSIGYLINASLLRRRKMQSIINARRSSICWRGRRELITDVRKSRNHGYDVIVGGAIYLSSRSPSQTCHAKPKIKSGAGRYQLLSCWWMPTASHFRKTSLRKVRRCGIAAD